MECFVCSGQEWHSMGDFNKERELRVCKVCGAAAYKVEPQDEQKILDYYRKEYRPAPNITNLLTCNHKQFYIKTFLRPWLEGKKGLTCGDVGSAIGYIPNMLRQLGHKAYGCEMTITYRRFSEHFYSIPLTEDLDPAKQYDLITIYHVLEHMVEPDKKLKKYAAMLKQDGRMMISTPEWFDILEEASGGTMTTPEHLFHKDHINVFSRAALKNLFWKAGLVIEREDHITYGQTYLLRKGTAEEIEANMVAHSGGLKQGITIDVGAHLVEPWEDQVKKLETMKAAMIKFKEGEQQELRSKTGGGLMLEALQMWPKFPEAYLGMIYGPYMKIPEKQEEFYQKAFAVMPDNTRLHLGWAMWLYQRARYEEAWKVLNWLMDHRPSEDIAMYRGWTLSNMGRHKEAMMAFNEAYIMSPLKWSEAFNWICREASTMPAWDEVANEQLKEHLLKQAEPKFTPQDIYEKQSGNEQGAPAQVEPQTKAQPVPLEVIEPDVNPSEEVAPPQA